MYHYYENLFSGSFYNNGEPTISSLDWITLASLRDSENAIFSYNQVEAETAGVIMWGKLTEWFEKAGYEKIFDNISIFSHSNINDIITLNDYIRKGYIVVSLISVRMLKGSAGETSGKNHWIVWEGEVSSKGKSINLDSENEIVNLNMFTWGGISERVRPNNDLNYFLKHTFGGLVFKPIK
ncbi:hypothetical protein [Xenorhabdus bovienii]|uniref:hypothetical protein n=1 Tax=Xenorhabdus bovienii TaxID=40576 RepID=UPI0023B2FD73|nr:hypothetical protein [Xenorhabdus bovienii]MDE9466841.1 hypothetical protein [Xenorhabdus bovienii]